MRVRSVIAVTAVLLGSFSLAAPPAHAVAAHNAFVTDNLDGSGTNMPPDFSTSAVEDPATHVITLKLKATATGATWWQLGLTPFTGQLAAATTYALAATPSASAVGATLQSCPLQGGTLKVLDLVRDGGGALTALGVDVGLDCSGWGGTIYYGFRWQSTSPDPRAANLAQMHNGFDPVDSGQTGASMPYVFANAGPADAHVSSVAIAGSNPTDFTITLDECSGAVIAPLDTCAIQVAFTPTAPYQRSAVLDVTDDSLRGHRSLILTAFAYGPPGPVTATATTRSDGVQVRWQVGGLGGRPLQYVEVLRGETADTLQHLGQVAAAAGTFPDRLGSATAPLADHDYVYALRAHTDHGDGPLTTMSAHVPAAAAPVTPDAVITLEGAWGVPNASGRTSFVDAASGGSMGVSVDPFGSGSTAVTGSVPSVASVRLDVPAETYGGDLTTKTYTHALAIDSGAVQCPSVPGSYTFDVHEVAYDSAGQVARLAADYLLSCGGAAPAVAGVVRWHSDLAYQAVTTSTPAADFPVKVGTTVPLVVTYRNAGRVPVTVSGVTLAPATAGGSTAAWALASTTCLAGALAPAAQCTATVNVTPGAATRQEVLVHFADDSVLTKHTRKLSAYGIVPTAAPVLSIQGVSSNGVALKWTQTYGVHAEPTSWQVYRKIGSSAYSMVKSLPRTGSASLMTWTDTYLGYGTRSYIVKSLNAAGASPYSAVRSTTLGPLVPRSVVATGLTRRVLVTWSPPLSSWTPQPLSGYAINRVSSTGALVRLGTRGKGGPLTWPVTGLAPGQKIGIRIQALYGSLVGPASTAIVGTATASNLLFAGYDGSNLPMDNAFKARGVTGGRIVDAAITQTNPSYGYLNLSSPPALSPNRQYMVLSGNPALAGWSFRLAVRRTDGAGGVRFLTPEGYSAWSPAVSRDGKWVAFSKILPTDGHVHLYRIPWGGGTPTLIPNSKDLDEPSWSADGKSVYATRVTDSNLGVVKLTLGGTRKTISSGRNESPVVSPDGTTVTFFTRGSSGSALKVLTVSTGAIRTLVSNTGGLATRASWTPNSATIYYTVYGSSSTLLRRINRSGTGLTALPSLGKSAHYVVYEQW